jgi:hypothetical protein
MLVHSKAKWKQKLTKFNENAVRCVSPNEVCKQLMSRPIVLPRYPANVHNLANYFEWPPIISSTSEFNLEVGIWIMLYV